ncbi:MAG: beta-propeller fold lactonase family protein [Bryobacterales bacterium]|nr:beta-propeller fold lactonase family protein [Bryobacterales bacterium]
MHLTGLLAGVFVALLSASAAPWLSPSSLAASPDGKTLFIAASTANEVLVFDVASGQVRRRLTMPAAPAGLVVSADGKRLYVTCAEPSSKVAVVDTARHGIVDTLTAGHTAMGPVLSPDGKTLFVLNRFNDDVSVIDLATKKQVRRIRVQREPTTAAISKDGQFLLVANHLHNGRADVDDAAAAISVIDAAAGKVVKELRLPAGSGALNDIRISPDGKYAFVTHILARTQVPTTQLDRGWINNNAGTVIDVARMRIVNTVLLDDPGAGAANPWGVAWSADSRTLLITHAGSHEVSIVDFAALLRKLAQVPAAEGVKEAEFVAASRVQADVPNDFSFLAGVRKRVALPEGDRGPRPVAVIGTKAYLGNYFSDTLSVMDWAAPVQFVESVRLGPKPDMTVVRQGEFYFHDATLCFQQWQSCSSCHPGGARTDALNWDLLNDGMNNPKNNRSLLLAHRTPPAMSLGVRESAEVAVRAGIKYILFTVQPGDVATALDEYLKSLQPVPSPHLEKGKLSPAALRGKELFDNQEVGCAACHPTPLFTNLKEYDTGTQGRFDKAKDRFDTPTLIEVWRTAPYLHDGSAATMRDVLTVKNPKDQHGKTSHLTPRQIEDLAEYVLSQ